MEQEESSHPPHTERNPTEKQNLTRGRLTGKEQTGGRRPPSQHSFSEKVGPEGNPRLGNTSRRPVELILGGWARTPNRSEGWELH